MPKLTGKIYFLFLISVLLGTLSPSVALASGLTSAMSPKMPPKPEGFGQIHLTGSNADGAMLAAETVDPDLTGSSLRDPDLSNGLVLENGESAASLATSLSGTVSVDALPESLTPPLPIAPEIDPEIDPEILASEPATDPVTAGATAPPRLSHELNLLVIRSLRKPVTNKVLDTGVFIEGIRPRGDDGDLWNRSFMTGNWGGLRDRLYDNGIDLVFSYFGEVYSNVSGGIDQGTAFNQVYIASGDFHTDRLGWWDDGFFHLTGSWLTGDSIARNQAGSLNSVYFGDPPATGPRLFEAFYSHDFDNGKVNLRVGRIYPFVKIGASQTAGLFTNTAFGYPAFLGSSPSSGMSAAYGAATWGVQLGYSPSRQWSFTAHVMDGFDAPNGGDDNRDGLKFKLSADEGAEGIFEVLYRANQNPGDTGLPGFYRAGAQVHTGQFNELSSLTSATPTQQRGNSAFFLTGEQMLYRESSDPTDRTQGLNGFAKVAFSPEEDINLVSLNLAGGVVYEGALPGRDRDLIGLAVAHTNFSDGARSLDRALASTSERNAETVVELTYAAEIAPWWLIVGSAQHILNPGGYSTIDDATVFGISSRFSF
jgi:porin